MIGYTMLGTRDMDRAEQFYNALLAEMGCGQLFKADRFIAWGDDSGQMFWSRMAGWWTDAGTFDSMRLANQFIQSQGA